MPRTVHTPPVARGQNPPGGLARVLCVPAVAATLALAVCGEATPPGSTADVVIDTIGDTVAVRTVSGSVWQGSATLVPETSIGELDGPDEYLFGNISSIAVDDEHTVYVFDGQAREVRVFDSGGTYIRTLGGPGEGPGEFSRVEAIAVLPDGRLVVRDAGTKHIRGRAHLLPRHDHRSTTGNESGVALAGAGDPGTQAVFRGLHCRTPGAHLGETGHGIASGGQSALRPRPSGQFPRGVAVASALRRLRGGWHLSGCNRAAKWVLRLADPGL